MNLFFLGCGLKQGQSGLVGRALKSTAQTYSSLHGGQFYSWQSQCQSTMVACQHPSPEWLGTRSYIDENDDAIVVYDGLPVDPSDRFAAHIASELQRNWDDAAHALDGYFCGIRILKRNLQTELQLDNFGAHPVYYWSEGDTWLISNSVGLLDKLSGANELDSAGVSRYLSMGWVAGNRTLRKGVRTFPAGERWIWKRGKPDPEYRQTASIESITGQVKSTPGRADFAQLSEEMARPLRAIGRNFDNVLCPLTGGRDSRVLAALLVHNKLAARYYTYGNKIGVDGEIAGEIAEALEVHHENLVTDSTDLLANWDDEAEKFVLQGDGMCPLHTIMSNDTAHRVATKPLPVRISGAGGGVLKAHTFNPYQEFRGMTVVDVQNNLSSWNVSNAGGLIRPEAVANARALLDRTVERYADQGVEISDLNDTFFLYEEEGRRVGQVMRPTTFLRDTYSPYCSRSVATAAFTVNARLRRTLPFHYGLLEALAPDLLGIRFDKGSWRSRSASMNFYQELAQQVRRRLAAKISARFTRTKRLTPLHAIIKDTGFERLKWLQLIRGKLREKCLDDRNSAMWEFVYRDKFDALTTEATSVDELSRNANILFQIATVHYYDALSRDRSAD
ncbi:MAG: hypothetical protein ACR2Q3_13835 [Woeseiaceae bacterium]